MGLTTDPNDPRLGRGADLTPGPQNEVYLVLSEEERAKGFLRPVRTVYRHVGIAGPKQRLRDLTDEERERYSDVGYAKFEEYPFHRPPTSDVFSGLGDGGWSCVVCGESYPCAGSQSRVTGRFWTQAQLESIGKGCGSWTTMGTALAETYARSPGFYGATYCCTCRRHLPVGADGEFVWEDGSRVGS